MSFPFISPSFFITRIMPIAQQVGRFPMKPFHFLRTNCYPSFNNIRKQHHPRLSPPLPSFHHKPRLHWIIHLPLPVWLHARLLLPPMYAWRSEWMNEWMSGCMSEWQTSLSLSSTLSFLLLSFRSFQLEYSPDSFGRMTYKQKTMAEQDIENGRSLVWSSPSSFFLCVLYVVICGLIEWFSLTGCCVSVCTRLRINPHLPSSLSSCSSLCGCCLFCVCCLFACLCFLLFLCGASVVLCVVLHHVSLACWMVHCQVAHRTNLFQIPWWWWWWWWGGGWGWGWRSSFRKCLIFLLFSLLCTLPLSCLVLPLLLFDSTCLLFFFFCLSLSPLAFILFWVRSAFLWLGFSSFVFAFGRTTSTSEHSGIFLQV